VKQQKRKEGHCPQVAGVVVPGGAPVEVVEEELEEEEDELEEEVLELELDEVEEEDPLIEAPMISAPLAPRAIIVATG
jgi:hypothetical protein